MIDALATFLARQMEWSKKTFGDGLRVIGITKHIEKECAEIRAKPADLSEWVDVIILALDGYWRNGGYPWTIMKDLNDKQEKNFARQWPAASSEDEPSEHIRVMGIDFEKGKSLNAKDILINQLREQIKRAHMDSYARQEALDKVCSMAETNCRLIQQIAPATYIEDAIASEAFVDICNPEGFDVNGQELIESHKADLAAKEDQIVSLNLKTDAYQESITNAGIRISTLKADLAAKEAVIAKMTTLLITFREIARNKPAPTIGDWNWPWIREEIDNLFGNKFGGWHFCPQCRRPMHNNHSSCPVCEAKKDITNADL